MNIKRNKIFRFLSDFLRRQQIIYHYNKIYKNHGVQFSYSKRKSFYRDIIIYTPSGKELISVKNTNRKIAYSILFLHKIKESDLDNLLINSVSSYGQDYLSLLNLISARHQV